MVSFINGSEEIADSPFTDTEMHDIMVMGSSPYRLRNASDGTVGVDTFNVNPPPNAMWDISYASIRHDMQVIAIHVLRLVNEMRDFVLMARPIIVTDAGVTWRGLRPNDIIALMLNLVDYICREDKVGAIFPDIFTADESIYLNAIRGRGTLSRVDLLDGLKLYEILNSSNLDESVRAVVTLISSLDRFISGVDGPTV